MHILVQVRYRNNREGLVDDVTLNELILSGQIKQFYRPSESRWINIDHDSIRAKSNGYKGSERREANKAAKKDEPVGLISRLLRRKAKEKPLSAKECFEHGFYIMHTSSDYQEAIRAFASSIQMDPTNARTYLNRGMSYERINNMQQAVADYSKAIELVPKDAKAYYIRGVLFWRLGKDMEALNDLRTSAELGYRQAKDFLNRKSSPTNEPSSSQNTSTQRRTVRGIFPVTW
jgi:tetratricopeptide (TPR) repeat protein